jgi:hypothetical protein
VYFTEKFKLVTSVSGLYVGIFGGRLHLTLLMFVEHVKVILYLVFVGDDMKERYC